MSNIDVGTKTAGPIAAAVIVVAPLIGILFYACVRAPHTSHVGHFISQTIAIPDMRNNLGLPLWLIGSLPSFVHALFFMVAASTLCRAVKAPRHLTIASVTIMALIALAIEVSQKTTYGWTRLVHGNFDSLDLIAVLAAAAVTLFTHQSKNQ